MITYPLNNIDYTAEDAELYFSTRESGVYDGNDFEAIASGIDNDVTVNVGIAWIQNSKFSGKVAALKEPKVLTLDLPDSVYDRIDAIVIQFDANANATDVVVKKGIASSAPVAPTVIQTESLYELHIYHVNRRAGANVINVEDLVDQRRNREYCGIMLDPISSVDDTFTKSGFAADSAAVGAALEAKAETASYKTTLPASGWSGSAPFTQSVAVAGILSSDEPFVDVFLEGVSDGTAILEAWMCVGRVSTANGSITAYCYEEKPATDIPIILKVVR